MLKAFMPCLYCIPVFFPDQLTIHVNKEKMKSFPIPAISNFANLVVYPSKQKVSHYFILDMIKQLKFREKAPFTCSVITVCLILRLLRSLFKLSFWRTMPTACFLQLVVFLVLSRCTLQCLDSSKIFSFTFLLARYEIVEMNAFNTVF